MNLLIIFRIEEAYFQFSKKAVMELLENKKSSYEIKELDDLIKYIWSQHDKVTLTFEEHPYFGFIALDLIRTSEGSVTCNNCGKQYRFNQLEAFKVRPDDANFNAASAKKKGLKNPFLKKPKPPGMYGGKGYKCPRGHILIYMQTWTT